MEHVFAYLMRFHHVGVEPAWRTDFWLVALSYNLMAIVFYGRRLIGDIRQRKAGNDSRPVNDAITAWKMGLLMFVLGWIPLIYHAVTHVMG